MNVTTTQSLGDLVAEIPSRAAVLDRLGIDYCCHGQRTLADACAEAGLDPASVATSLDTAPTGTDEAHPRDLAALADHIENTHHRYLHAELPELDALAAKVTAVHGERHPELAKVHQLVTELVADLEPHMGKEERVLFPAIRAIAAGGRDFPFGTVRNPIQMMELDHERAGELLAALRTTTSGYSVPDDGCASYRSLYQRLADVETDTHRHIHLENNVLFPAAIAAENARERREG